MRCMVIVLAVVLGCGGAEQKGARHKSDEQQVDPARAEQLIKQSESKKKQNAFAEARELLREAYRYSDPEIRHRIGLAHEELDEAQAAHVAQSVQSQAKGGKCVEAIGQAAGVVEKTAETSVPGLLAQKSGDAVAKCVAGVIEAGELARARKIMADPNTKKAIDPKRQAALAKQLEAAIMEALDARVAEPTSARDWTKVTAALHAAVKSGEAGTEHREKLLAKVRQGISEDVEKIVADSFGQPKGAKEALTKVDTLLAAGFWKPRPVAADKSVDPETARLMRLLEPKTESKPAETKAGDEPTQVLPEKLDKARRELAFWVGCDSLKCKGTDPAQQWTFGHAPLHSPLAPKENTNQKINTGKPVWRIAEGGGLTLVAVKDPGALADLKARAHAGVGWVPSTALKAQDTSEWLPPGDSLVGTRVWAPLRENATDLELGKVIGVDGPNVQIQRLADQNVMLVARNRVHFGLTKKGTKVLALCGTTSMQPAVIDKVIEPKHESLGDPRAVLRCLDDKGNPGSKTREDPLGAVRTKREWLPPQK